MKIGTMEKGDNSLFHFSVMSFSKLLQKCNFITEILRVCYNCVNIIDI